jgi:O-antigen/teichoic acid export membrane protein
MRDIVIRSTRINTLLNVASTAVVIAYGERLLRLWVGTSYARQAYPILIVLMITQTIRLSGSGYSIALMATGHQNSGIAPAVIEAIVNLVASLWAVVRFGPMGVAYGSLLGAALAIPCLLFFAVRARKDLTITRADLAIKGMLLGLLPAVPALACSILVLHQHMAPSRLLGLWTLSIACGVLLFLRIDRGAKEALLSGDQNVAI